MFDSDMLLKFLLLAVVVATASAIGVGRTQSAAVRGRLICDGKPAVGVKVKLWDDDRGVFLEMKFSRSGK